MSDFDMCDAYEDLHLRGYYSDGSSSFGEDRASYSPTNQTNKVCKFCGKTRLKWIKTEDGWRLGDYTSKIHICPNKPLTTKSKEVVNYNESYKQSKGTLAYKLLNAALEGICLSDNDLKEYYKLLKHCKDKGLTVENILGIKK